MVLSIAHRGASGYFLENTRASLEGALALNADIIEVDVRETLDHQLVLSHDLTLTRLIGVPKNAQSVLASMVPIPLLLSKHLSQVILRNGQQPYFLKDVFKRVGAQKILKLDIKLYVSAKSVSQFLEEYACGRTVYLAGDKKTIDLIYSPSVEILREHSIKKQQYRARKEGRLLKQALVRKAEILAPHFSIISDSLIRHAHEYSLIVHAWTVNEPADIKQAIAQGVDAITSNYPERVKYFTLPTQG
ncbi:hypothetical protein COT72_02575 [archaeon CG10_big_fil_rev_8_21_14_0_10_43_11]|nr:MAG: hypothetical protein COT72_02575 [archaeon CG10_big_fil_rev_8_21_14_0_10_43_11]